tara:strand:- start:334 stop:480 length:147 start_codon:yes stop_codon:yes gene_type:complete
VKEKKLVKKALKNPKLYTIAELRFLKVWNAERKKLKKLRKKKNKEEQI